MNPPVVQYIGPHLSSTSRLAATPKVFRASRGELEEATPVLAAVQHFETFASGGAHVGHKVRARARGEETFLGTNDGSDENQKLRKT